MHVNGTLLSSNVSIIGNYIPFPTCVVFIATTVFYLISVFLDGNTLNCFFCVLDIAEHVLKYTVFKIYIQGFFYLSKRYLNYCIKPHFKGMFFSPFSSSVFPSIVKVSVVFFSSFLSSDSAFPSVFESPVSFVFSKITQILLKNVDIFFRCVYITQCIVVFKSIFIASFLRLWWSVFSSHIRSIYQKVFSLITIDLSVAYCSSRRCLVYR